MAHLRSLPLCVLAAALSSFGVSAAQTAPAITPAKRIVSQIDNNQLVTLNGNTHPAANARNDRGAVSPDLPMTDLILVLSRSAEQQAAFDAFVESQNDPNSPNYHQWLTPDEVGAEYGPSLTDIATITNWLTSQGFTVTQVTRDHMSIRFDGTAGKVARAFHTQIHNLAVNGKSHIGNMSDPQIPAAIAPVVVGIKSLHNFFPRPMHHVGQSVTRDAQTGHWVRQSNTVAATQSASAARGGIQPQIGSVAKPQFGITGTSNGSQYKVEDIGPWDFATIYNVAPLWNAGIDGTGQTIAIAATSAIDAGESSSVAAGASGANDVATFRSFFNLPTGNSYNTPIQIAGNSQPLTVCTSTSSSALCGIGDLEENTLDVEWSGAVAKNAQIILVASYPASASDDNLYDSESYIVDHLTSRVMSVSYGACELGLGTAGNVQYYNLWETAQAEGIAVFVATGDSGSPACDQGGDLSSGVPYAAEFGQSVNGLASTPFNTAVGGTDFNWCSVTSSDNCVSEAATYWNTSNNSTNQSSAKGYVPEVPWNDTCTSSLAVPFLVSFFQGTPYQASNGANYSVTDAETGCNAIAYYQTQLQQAGDSVLLNLVDTVGGGGGASGCVVNDGQNVSSCSGSITSTGSSYGSIPLANDGWVKPSWQSGVTGIPGDGVRDQPDVSFFASDGFLSSSAYLICVSAAATCTYSATTEPSALEVGGTSVATPTMAGVMALINQKAGAPQGSPNAQLYSLAAKQNYGSCSADSAPGSNCYFNDIDKGTIAMACDYSYNSNTPSPNCAIAHAGDYIGILPGYSATTGYDLATGLGSLNVANVVNGWTAGAVKLTPTITVTPASTAINSNASLNVTVSVAGSGATPTGTITLNGGGYTSAVETIGTSPCASASSCVFTIPANSLGGSSAGQADTLTAVYSGDGTYASGVGTAQVTVTSVASSGSFALTNSGNITVKAGATTGNTSTISITPSGGFTGTVSLKCAITPSASSDPASCALSTYSVTLSGTTAQTSMLTISTTAKTSSNNTPKLFWPSSGGAVLALLFFFVPKRRRNWRSMLGVLVLFASGLTIGCGSSGASSSSSSGTGTTANPGTTTGTYTVTITGTAGSASQTTTVSLTIQ